MCENESKNIGLSILKKRLELGLSQREVADFIGTSQGRISKIESGRNDLKAAEWLKLSRKLTIYPESVLNRLEQEIEAARSINLKTLKKAIRGG